jgi:hypothetical protein
MSTERLRRELEALKARGVGDCRGCGYPNYPLDKNVVIKTVLRRPGDPPLEHTPEHCEVCGREKKNFIIRMKGLDEKPRGDTWHKDKK